MLPQKFSAATTRIPPDPEVVPAVLVAPQPATAARSRTGSSRREIELSIRAAYQNMRLSLVICLLRLIIAGIWG